jgi:hypothetical protein
MLKEMNTSPAAHLPVVAAFCRRIGLAKVVNAVVPTEMAIDVGTVVQLMVLDTLSGRSPLYRLETFGQSLDTGLLLGRKIPAGAFNDTTLGRAREAIYEAGTQQLFSQIAYLAARAFLKSLMPPTAAPQIMKNLFSGYAEWWRREPIAGAEPSRTESAKYPRSDTSWRAM